MLTVVESALFARLWPDYWSPEEYGDFILHLALNPEAGVVIPCSGGCRKIRWSRPGMGKRGGVRVVYAWMPLSGMFFARFAYASIIERLKSWSSPLMANTGMRSYLTSAAAVSSWVESGFEAHSTTDAPPACRVW